MEEENFENRLIDNVVNSETDITLRQTFKSSRSNDDILFDGMNLSKSKSKIEYKERPSLISEKSKQIFKTATTITLASNINNEIGININEINKPNKSKKPLKLITNPQNEFEEEKSKSLSPQTNPNFVLSKSYYNFFSFTPGITGRILKKKSKTNEVHYYEKIYDVTTKVGHMSYQQDRVKLIN